MKSQSYFDSYLKTHFMESNKDKKGFENMSKFYELNYKQHMPSDKSARILDIGCGMGHFLFFLKKQGHKNYLGVDISREAVEYCKSNISTNVLLIDNLEGFLNNNCSEYDLIIMNDVIEHLPKERVIIIMTAIRRSLKVDGKVVVKTLNSASTVSSYLRYHDFTHEVGFTEQSLSQVLMLSGYCNVAVYPIQYYKCLNIKRATRLLFNRLLHFIWRFIFYIEFQDIPKIVTNLLICVGTRTKDGKSD